MTLLKVYLENRKSRSWASISYPWRTRRWRWCPCPSLRSWAFNSWYVMKSAMCLQFFKERKFYASRASKVKLVLKLHALDTAMKEWMKNCRANLSGKNKHITWHTFCKLWIKHCKYNCEELDLRLDCSVKIQNCFIVNQHCSCWSVISDMFRAVQCCYPSDIFEFLGPGPPSSVQLA